MLSAAERLFCYAMRAGYRSAARELGLRDLFCMSVFLTFNAYSVTCDDWRLRSRYSVNITIGWLLLQQ